MKTDKTFEEQKLSYVSALASDEGLKELSRLWMQHSGNYHYAYNFSWMGRPIIQLPQDIIAIQEIAWEVKPDLIIETGIAHGGSLVMSASILALIDYCEALGKGVALNPRESKRRVLGIDIEIRPHNRQAIEVHPLAHLIEMIEGSSVSPGVVEQVRDVAAGYEKILVFLDSNHSHDHVLAELESYAPLTSVGSYCVVWDTAIEDLPESCYCDRPWGKGNNPKTAVYEYLKRSDCFEIDKLVGQKLLITAAPDGFLRRRR